MKKYVELQSEHDRLPDSFTNMLMLTKKDVQCELDNRLKTLYRAGSGDSRHSMKYYVLLMGLIKEFKHELSLTVLPNQLENWWRYTYEISHKGVRLYVEHINTIWLEEGTENLDEETVDQVFLLLSHNAKTLTVEEYARLYEVEPVTVRQWIRRGKLREAEKVGKEWRISELTDVPGRTRYEPATYKWITALTGLPDELTFLTNFTDIDIRKREGNVTDANPEITYYAFCTNRADRRLQGGRAVPLTDKRREQLEAYLIANPDVLFTGNTRAYSYKHKEAAVEDNS